MGLAIVNPARQNGHDRKTPGCITRCREMESALLAVKDRLIKFANVSIATRRRIRVLALSYRLRSCGKENQISKTAKIYNKSKLSIGSHVSINDYVHIWAGGGVDIGDHTLIAAHVVITSETHDINALSLNKLYRETHQQGAVLIGKNVWIGSGAVVLPGLTIGDDAVVAAGAVVTKNVGPKSLVAGVPARQIRLLQ